jgi:hypothetical protein
MCTHFMKAKEYICVRSANSVIFKDILHVTDNVQGQCKVYFIFQASLIIRMSESMYCTYRADQGLLLVPMV